MTDDPPSIALKQGKCGCTCKAECPCACACPCSCVCKQICEGKCKSKSKTGRTLVVSIDGTSNHFAKKNTNVVELHSQIIKDDGPKQLTYYRSGIGAYPHPVRLRHRVIRMIQSAVAWHFERIVEGAYRWLADHYKPGDKIFLFGFSRGAYQVRALAGMIETVGLMYPGNLEEIPFAYSLYRYPNSESDELASRFKATYSRNVKVHFVGVWDTVSSIGMRKSTPFPLTETCDHICVVRHALALDERRVKFLPEYFKPPRSGYGTGLLKSVKSVKESPDGIQIQGASNQPWKDSKGNQQYGTDLKEVWFAGCHSDIGGGNGEDIDLNQARIPLLWMENEVRAAGLRLKPRKHITWDWEKLQSSKPTESLIGLWKVPEYLPLKRLLYINDQAPEPTEKSFKTTRVPHHGKGRVIMDGQRIHASVAFKDKTYTPKAELTNFDWKRLVGTGKNDDDLSWAENTGQLLEMDLFDLALIQDAIDNLGIRDEATRIYNLNRLAFIATSRGQPSYSCSCHRKLFDASFFLVKGAETIIKKNTTTDRILELLSVPTLREHSIKCILQLVKNERIRLQMKTKNVIETLTRELANEDSDIWFNVLDCLSRLVLSVEQSEVNRIFGAFNQPGLLTKITTRDEKMANSRASSLYRLLIKEDVPQYLVGSESVTRFAEQFLIPMISNSIANGEPNPLATFPGQFVKQPKENIELLSVIVQGRNELVLGFPFLSLLLESDFVRQVLLENSIIPDVKQLLESDHSNVRKKCLDFIQDLIVYDDTRSSVIDANTIPVVIQLIQSSPTYKSAAAVFSRLSEDESAQRVTYDVITEALKDSSPSTKFAAVWSLSLLRNCDEYNHNDTGLASLIDTVVTMMMDQNERPGIRTCCSVTLSELAKYNVIRRQFNQPQVIQRIGDMLRVFKPSTPLDSELLKCGADVDSLHSLSGLTSPSDHGITVLAKLANYDDCITGILDAACIDKAIPLLQSDDAELQRLGALFFENLAKDDTARQRILETMARKILVGMAHNFELEYTVRWYARDAIRQLDVVAVVMPETNDEDALLEREFHREENILEANDEENMLLGLGLAVEEGDT